MLESESESKVVLESESESELQKSVGIGIGIEKGLLESELESESLKWNRTQVWLVMINVAASIIKY